MTEIRDQATCRCCKTPLKGTAYMYGGDAYHPKTGERCKVNFYGGYVCSDLCDRRATYDLEESMPGNRMGRSRP